MIWLSVCLNWISLFFWIFLILQSFYKPLTIKIWMHKYQFRYTVWPGFQNKLAKDAYDFLSSCLFSCFKVVIGGHSDLMVVSWIGVGADLRFCSIFTNFDSFNRNFSCSRGFKLETTDSFFSTDWTSSWSDVSSVCVFLHLIRYIFPLSFNVSFLSVWVSEKEMSFSESERLSMSLRNI